MQQRLVKDILDTRVTVKGSSTGYTSKGYLQKDLALRTILFALGERYSSNINALREFEYHSPEQKTAKSALPFFYIGGTFPYRSIKDASLITPSNLMCLDIDLVDNTDVDIMSMRKELFELPYVVGCYLSVSGRGIYLIVSIEDSSDPVPYYKYLARLFKQKYSITVDAGAINTARARVLSYEDDILSWTKPEDSYVEVWTLKYLETAAPEKHPVSIPKKVSLRGGSSQDLLMNDDFCYKAAKYAINKLGMCTNLSNNMKDWLGHLATLSLLGERGHELALDLSRRSSGYLNDAEVTKTFKKYSSKTTQETRQFFTRYFKYCKDRLGSQWVSIIKNEGQQLKFEE